MPQNAVLVQGAHLRLDRSRVSKRLNVSEDPPAGLIAHVLTDIPGGVYATEIRESEADFQTFARERLMPIAGAIAEERGISMERFSEPAFAEAHDLQAPRR